jgi:hypothetical protein
MVSGKDIELASSLLAKAQSTDFDPEAAALVEKSYILLAKVLTAYDDADTTPCTRRRERRHLRDRRAANRTGNVDAADRAVDPAVTYRRLDDGRRAVRAVHFDVTA